MKHVEIDKIYPRYMDDLYMIFFKIHTNSSFNSHRYAEVWTNVLRDPVFYKLYAHELEDLYILMRSIERYDGPTTKREEEYDARMYKMYKSQWEDRRHVVRGYLAKHWYV